MDCSSQSDFTPDGIVLLAKNTNITSFSSLNSVKKALGTSKVGHTGTLDSFAQGLLVVCTGRLTRLAGNITAFNKTYDAVIKFGEETDTLEYTGKIIRRAEKPSLETLKGALYNFIGNLMQVPPSFSAIHIDGKRASSLARNGVITEIPPRPVTIFLINLIDTKLDENGLVDYALIKFTVSKGTYIRSLARDIGKACGSAAHLVGLYRTSVGNFSIQNAAGYNSLEKFTIDSVISGMENNLKILADGKSIEVHPHFEKGHIPQEELNLQEEIRRKKVSVDQETATMCGFEIINLISQDATLDFRNGKPLKSRLFNKDLHSLPNDSVTAVFSPEPENYFTGLIEKNDTGRISYKFVIN